MVICRVCRKRFKAQDRVCPRCGWSVEELYKTNCPFCGELISSSSRICPRCGVDLSVAHHGETPLVEPHRETPAPPYPTWPDWTERVSESMESGIELETEAHPQRFHLEPELEFEETPRATAKRQRPGGEKRETPEKAAPAPQTGTAPKVRKPSRQRALRWDRIAAADNVLKTPRRAVRKRKLRQKDATHEAR